ncbi:hypothetical protein PCIT_a0968 [Pseudoalteromonas citrea]|uniref:Response regulatory domain-containing protein n=2 Tax=Pseudoalteromonas citrea TaxID=43655 RepID=A0AAD4ALP5_9GAMM|nr:response regulator [Pseudoalteromonas citrea]KAF7774510.1 hypothetical protein PCIT_a0968 [Pseudoalteromonas citrea]
MSAPRILIIDDEKFYRSLLKETFTNHTIELAHSGEEGIEKAQTFQPDLILLDIVMTGISGFDVCMQLRNLETMQHTPIVFISNLTSVDGRIKAFEIGANDFICKTVHPDEIKVKIESLLNSEKQHFAALEVIDETSSLLIDLQKQNAYMKAISLFMQASHYCSDIKALTQILMNTLHALNLKAVVYFTLNQTAVSTSDHVAKLEQELLKHHKDLEHIHKLAQGSVIFNWRTTALLAKNVGERTDIIAHLMDALEMAITHIERQSSLVAQILSIETHNKAILESIQNSVDDSKVHLKSQLFESGLVSKFDLQDEDDLDKLIADSGEDLYQLIHNFNGNAEKVTALLGTLKKPPHELRFLFKENPQDSNNVLF